MCPWPNPPRQHFCLPGPLSPSAKSTTGKGPRAAPPRPVRESCKAAQLAPPLPCRPRPGAPMGFSMTASGRGPPLFPLSLAVARLSPARRGFSRAQLEHDGTASPPPASCAQTRAAPSAGPRDHLRGAEPSAAPPFRPSCPCCQGLRPLSPIFVHKVDGAWARAPPRFVRRSRRSASLAGRRLGGGSQASAPCRASAGQPVPPGCGRASAFLPRGSWRSPDGSKPDGPHRGGEPRRAHAARQRGDIARGPPRAGTSRVETRPPARENGYTRGQ